MGEVPPVTKKKKKKKKRETTEGSEAARVTVAHDPSVADYRATSPSEWGGIVFSFAHPLRPPSRQEAAGRPGSPARDAAAQAPGRRSAGAAEVDLAALFGGPREVWLEVGFGAGEHLVWQAEQHPDVGLIGCEPYMNGVAKCLAHIERTGVGNVRLFTDDARLVMAALPEQSLSRAFVLFPDPWPKTRHHKRRFVRATRSTCWRG